MAHRTILIAIACAFAACRTERPPPAAPAAKPSLDPAREHSPLDARFREYQKQLPAAASISESNGASLQCRRGDYATYTLLDAIARRVPIARDGDLMTLVPWAHDPDPCIRQIAIAVIVDRIALDTNSLSQPGMHDPEHYHFHAIFVALHKYLRAKHVAVPASTFEGMWLTVAMTDFALLHGIWEEAVSPAKNLRRTVEIDGEHIRVTTRRTRFDPMWPDHTWTTKIARVMIDAQQQIVVMGAWNVESNATGYQGDKLEPSQFTYTIVPVSGDIIWFDDSDAITDTKLLRIAK